MRGGGGGGEGEVEEGRKGERRERSAVMLSLRG